MSDDLSDRLEDRRREKEWASTWEPEASGDTLIGTLEAVEMAPTEFGECRVAHVRTEDGVLRALWLMHKVLRDEWDAAEPTPGDRVGALYQGERSGESHDYHVWAVEVERRDEAPQAEPEADAEPDPTAVDRDRGKNEAAGRGPAPTLDNPNADLPY